MQRGNIDNKLLPAIAIRFEGVIQVLGLLNRASKSFLEQIFFQEVRVVLVTLLDRRKVMSFCYKYAVPYNGILQADSILEIPELCEEHKFLIYFDSDPKVLETVGNRGIERTETKLWTEFENR